MKRTYFASLVRLGTIAPLIIFVLGLGSAFAQGPAIAHSEQTVQISTDECNRRASRAFRSEGYNRAQQSGNNAYYATKSGRSAYVMCVADRERNRTRVIVVTADDSFNDSTSASERSRILRRMERSGGGNWGGNSGSGRNCGLGRRIVEYENDFTGIWTRRGNTSTFDSVWTRGSERVYAVLDISLVGNRITVQRTDADGRNACTYNGYVESDGSVTGTYSCRSGENNIPWEAQIECNN